MNANELMIGDWVYAKVQVDDTGTEPVFERTPKRVTDLTKGINGIYVEGTSTFAGAEIEPIPLTPELLTNNGFTLENKNKYPRRYRLNLNTHCGDYIIVDFDCYNQLSKKNWSFPIQMCMLVGNDRFCENFVRIYQYDYLYVHQLQHALRLAGINKEIVL